MFPRAVRLAERRRRALTSFSILSNIRLVSWGFQWNGKDLAMLRFKIFPTRRGRPLKGRWAFLPSMPPWLLFAHSASTCHEIFLFPPREGFGAIFHCPLL